MRHGYSGKKLSRSNDERRGLFRNLIRSLVLHGSIKTTKTKAQAITPEIDKLITKAKQEKEHAHRDVQTFFGDRVLAERLIAMAETRFSGRTSGYTRTVHLGKRRGDATEVVLVAFVDEEIISEVVTPKVKKLATKIEEKKEIAKKLVSKKTVTAKKETTKK